MALIGGPYKTEDGREAIRALTWAQVDGIVALLDRLNPYDGEAVKEPILKIESDNRDPNTNEQRQLWCLAISAKRYALFLRDRNGEPVLLRKGANNEEDRWSEHGLGHLLNPSDPTGDDRSWIAQAWLAIVRRSLGLAAAPLSIADRVAVGQITVSSPEVLKPLEAFNAGKPYAQQIKPFNFILSAHVAPFGHPSGADPERFHLIAPYESDPRKWEKLPWIDEYSEKPYRISASLPSATRSLARVKSYGDVLEEYEYHEEAKCADASGEPCDRQSVGLLGRRRVRIEKLHLIGKESNKLEEVEELSVTDDADVYTEYPDPRRDEWKTKWLPMLQSTPAPTLLDQGVSRATIYAARAGRELYGRTKVKLVSALKKIAKRH
jgi:hypothetical protein